MTFSNPAGNAAAAASGYVRALLEFLGDRDPLEVAAGQVAWLEEHTAGRPDAVLRRPESVEAALAGLEDPDEKVREAALAALFRLTGMRDFDPGAPEAERREAAAGLQALWSRVRDSWK